MTHPRLECNPARDAQVKVFCVCVCGLLVSYLIPPVFTLYLNDKQLSVSHWGKPSFAGSFVSHKRVEDGDVYQCDSESFITAPEQRRRCDVVSHYSPQKALFFFFGCLAHFLYPTRTPPIITCPSMNLIGCHMPYCPLSIASIFYALLRKASLLNIAYTWSLAFFMC